ncbi:tryptophan 2,3-dioxygenase family protein [Streptomyces sp. NPDC053431]|uniref:tryptophan 2,3-dioxygenase family protein n=1 Tax=Streptomyces sp. NPDC053431 TaxID=3365703 RepID=UPI0037D8D4D8
MLGQVAADCHAPDQEAILSAALQAADTAMQALAALHTTDRWERLEQLREAVAGARATVLTCTMAIYRGTGHPAADTDDMTDRHRTRAAQEQRPMRKTLPKPQASQCPAAPTQPGPPCDSADTARAIPQTTGRTAPAAPADFTYGQYLRLPALLAQHAPASAAHDEHLFITVHQVHELWFQLLLTELSGARDRMLAGEAQPARIRIERCRAIEHTLLDTLHLLDTMTPHNFLAFRGCLGTASGAQSAQFHEIEILSRRRDSDRIGRMGWLTPTERARLEERMAEPSLWDGFLRLLTGAGHDVSTRQLRRPALAAITRDPDQQPLFGLAQSLLGHDQSWSLWRTHHAQVAERQIGRRPGTGGTPGAAYLQAHLDTRFFPELWETPPHSDPEP